MDLSQAPLQALVDEIARRSKAAVIVALLKEGTPEANLRMFIHHDGRNDMLPLLAVADLAHDEVRSRVRKGAILGPE